MIDLEEGMRSEGRAPESPHVMWDNLAHAALSWIPARHDVPDERLHFPAKRTISALLAIGYDIPQRGLRADRRAR